jgi:glycosyltransferase involved in cell wall biosynthesis
VQWQADGQTLPLERRRQTFHDMVTAIGPKIVHANSLAMARLTGPVCRQLGVSSIGYLRDIVRVSQQVVRDLACHGRLVAVSNATRLFHVNQGLDPSLIRVVYNGIDELPHDLACEPHRAFDEFARKTSPERAFVIGGVGQIGLRKGWDVFVAAAKIAAPSLNNVHWVIAGSRHSSKHETVVWERQLHSQTAEPPLLGRFHWLGRVQAMPAFYRSLDLLVHPARQEPFGRALLEAAICGVPIVATDAGGTREMFPPVGHTVQLCPIDDPHALADAIIGLHGDSQLASQRARRARQRIRSVFTTNRCAVGLDRLYRELVQP